jgi:hypothetical protein
MTRSIPSPWLIVLVTVLPLAASAAPSKLETLFGETGLALLKEAPQARAVRLAQASLDKVSPAELVRGRVLGSELAARFGRVLLEQKSFNFNVVKRCARGGVAVGLIWSKGERSLVVSFDFRCSQLEVVTLQAGKRTHHDATWFDPARAVVLSLVKEALPGDARVQALR